MSAYARALRRIPEIIADNAGLDFAEIVSQMRAANAADPSSTMGVDVVSGSAGDMRQRGIYESFKVKSTALASASDAVEMILRVDDIIRCAPRARDE